MKVRKLIVSLLLGSALAVSASAQLINTSGGKTSDDVLLKIHKVELINQILPLFLTREQINGKILPLIEKSRERWKTLLQEEDTILSKMGPILDETITKAVDSRIYPKLSILTDMQAKTKSMQMKRALTTIQIVDEMDVMLKETLDEGQMKALLGSFDARFIEPGKKPDELSPDAKRQFFIRNVFLDPLARELLIDIAKKLPADGSAGKPTEGAEGSGS